MTFSPPYEHDDFNEEYHYYGSDSDTDYSFDSTESCGSCHSYDSVGFPTTPCFKESTSLSCKRLHPCRDISLGYSCRRKNCKYNHDTLETPKLDEYKENLKLRVSEAISNPNLRSNVELLLIHQDYQESDFYKNITNLSFSSTDTSRKWIMAMLKLSIDQEKNRFFSYLSKDFENCLSFFEILANAQYKVTLNRDNTGIRIFSFQLCFLPLLFLLSHSKTAAHPLHHLTTGIYAIFIRHLPRFFNEFLVCANKCLNSLSLEGQDTSSSKHLQRDEDCFVPFSFAQVYYPFVRFLSILNLRFPDPMRKNEIKDLIAKLETQISQWEKDFQANKLFTLESEFAILLVKNDLILLQESLQEDFNDPAILLEQRARQISFFVFRSKDAWPDGPLKAPTGIHDNDFADFRKIRVIPTMKEILSPHFSTLPGNLQTYPYAHWLKPGPLRLLDTHFRLLRHDMLVSIKLGLNSLIPKLPTIIQTKRFKQGFGSSNVDLMVYTNIKFQEIGLEIDCGDCLTIRYLVPPYLKTKIEFNHFFETRLLKDGFVALVCAQPTVKIYFATIVSKNESVEKIQSKTSTVVLKFAKPYPLPFLLQIPNKFVMVEINGFLFESYRPILSALQSIHISDVPFTSILCPSTDLQKIKPPSYSWTRNYEWNLNFLKKNPSLGEDLKFCPMRFDSKHLETLLVKNANLDQSQSKALIAALTQEVCCIQGPPGTGKSYIGIKIVEALYKSVTDSCFPILVLCHTNHALDQFLESLVDKDLHSLVRLGFKTTEKLKSYKMKKHNVLALYEKKKKWNEASKNIYPVLNALSFTERPIASKPFYSFLKARYEKQISCIEKNGKKSGFVNNFICWLKGEDLSPLIDIVLDKHQSRSPLFKYFFSEKDKCQDGQENSDSIDFIKKTSENFSHNDCLQSLNNCLNGLHFSDSTIVDPIKNDSTNQTNSSANSVLSKLLKVENVWSLTLKQRTEVYTYWSCSFREFCSIKLEKLKAPYMAISALINELEDFDCLSRLESKKIIGMTSTFSAKKVRLIQAIQPKVIICEEAGEILEAHILASLGRSVQHLILIGDHLQLRPHIREYSLSVESREGKKYRLDESLFERLIKIPKFPKYSLTSQRRMRPLVSQFIRAIAYPKLDDCENTKEYPDMKGVAKNVFFLNHSNPQTSGEESFGRRSHSNLYEVDMIVAMTSYFIDQGYNPEQIVILTPYAGQLLKILEALEKKELSSTIGEHEGSLPKGKNTSKYTTSSAGAKSHFAHVLALQLDDELDTKSAIRVSTIDNYQGEESDIVLISLVRSTLEDGTQRGIGFLNIDNRINVLLSRARHGMYILGNAKLLETHSKVWSKVIDLLRQQSLIGDALPISCQSHPTNVRLVNSPEGFTSEALNRGCLLPCLWKRSMCGHTCKRTCSDCFQVSKWIHGECLEPCGRTRSCKHICKTLCNEHFSNGCCPEGCINSFCDREIDTIIEYKCDM